MSEARTPHSREEKDSAPFWAPGFDCLSHWARSFACTTRPLLKPEVRVRECCVVLKGTKNSGHVGKDRGLGNHYS